MKSIFTKIILLSLFLSIHFTAQSQDNPWSLKAEKEGIKIYNRSVDHSRIKELKMTTTVETTLSALVNILNDVPRYPEWMHGCKGGELVDGEAEEAACYMTTIQFPKPLAWRVMFTKNIIEQDPVTKVVTLKTVPIKKETFNDETFVVMEEVYTTWILRPMGNGTVAIESYLFCDPSGNIPYWLVNSLLDKGPLKSILRLLKRLKEPEFKNVDLEEIKD